MSVEIKIHSPGEVFYTLVQGVLVAWIVTNGGEIERTSLNVALYREEEQP